jgi:phage-related protein
MDAITTALAENFGGFAAQRAETFSGKMDRLKIAFDEGKETIGGFVLDAITPLVTLIVEKVVPAVSNLSGKIGEGLKPVFKNISEFVTNSLIPTFTDLWDYFTKNIVPLFTSYASLLSVTLLPAIKALWGFIQDYLVPIFKATLTPVITEITKVFGKLKDFVEDNNGVFTFLGAVMGVIGGAAKILAPIIGTTLGLAFKGVGLIIDGVSLAISGVVAGINLAIDTINLLIKGYNAVNNLFGGKDISLIPDVVLSKGAKTEKVTPAAAKAVQDEIKKEVGDVAKQVAKETAAITAEATKTAAKTVATAAVDELKGDLGGTTGNIGEAMFAIRQRESGFIPPVVPVGTDVGERMFRIRQMEAGNVPPTTINVNVSGAIDQEGTARTIVDTLNNSFYRGTNGARALAL